VSGDAVVTAISTTAVKGLHLQRRSEVLLTETGVPDNRAFYLIDAEGRMVNDKRVGALMAVTADYDLDADRLELRFPDGTRIVDTVRDGPPVETTFFSQRLAVPLVLGPFAQALSQFAGEQLRLVRAHPERGAVDRGAIGAVSVISRASLGRLGELAREDVDGRRFRMLFEVDGLAAHEEDELVGRRARIGEAIVEFEGHVGRCRVTGLDPDTGRPTLPTLQLLEYRRGLATTEPLAFGVYGRVLEPGTVRVGDRLVARTDRR
jgi:uncharacterized protein YcbX